MLLVYLPVLKRYYFVIIIIFFIQLLYCSLKEIVYIYIKILKRNVTKSNLWINFKGKNGGDKTGGKGHEEKSMKEVEKGNDKQQDKCSICFKEFELVLLLNEHYIVYKKTLQCKQCKEYSDTVMEFEKHKKCKQIFHCDICGKKFDDVAECAKHMESCVGKLKCTNCDETSSHWKLLLQHNEDLYENKS